MTPRKKSNHDNAIKRNYDDATKSKYDVVKTSIYDRAATIWIRYKQKHVTIVAYVINGLRFK